MKHNTSALKALAALTVASAAFGTAQAQTNWVGNTSTNINDAANWSADVPTGSGISAQGNFTTAGSAGSNLVLTVDYQFPGGTAPGSNAMLFDGDAFTISGNSSTRQLTIGGQGLAINTNNTITLDVARVRRNASNTFEFLGSNGNLVINSEFSTSVTGASDFLTRVDFTAAGGNDNTITFNGNIVKVFTGVPGAGNGNLTISSVGTGNRVVFNNASNSGITGAVTVGSNAILQLGNGGTNGTLAGAGAISLGNSASSLTVNQTDTVTQGTEFSTSAITGTGKVQQNGSGSLVLNADNTYSGGTTVNAGTLVVNNLTGSGTGSGSVTVASGARLAGTGTIGGSVVVTGIMAPGNSIGTLNTGSATWKGASLAGSATDWQFELGAGDTSDLLNITGNFLRDTTDGSVFRYDFLGSSATGNFTLVDWSGSTTFNVSNFTYTGLAVGNTGTFEISGSQLNFNVVPEPSTITLMAAGVGIVALLRRRRA